MLAPPMMAVWTINRILRQKNHSEPLAWAFVGLGTWQGFPSVLLEWGSHVHRKQAGSSSFQSFSSGPEYISPFIFLGGGEAKRDFIQVFSPPIKQKTKKKKKSQKRMRRNTYTLLQLRRPGRQTGRQTLTHTQAIGPFAATHHLVFLLVPPPSGGMRGGNRQATLKLHPSPYPRLSNQTRLKGRGDEKGALHILVSLADSCSSLVQASHGDTHISTHSESTGCQWGHLQMGSQPISFCCSNAASPTT